MPSMCRFPSARSFRAHSSLNSSEFVLRTDPVEDLVHRHTVKLKNMGSFGSHKSRVAPSFDSPAGLQLPNDESLEDGFPSSGHIKYQSTDLSSPKGNEVNVTNFDDMDMRVLFNADSLRQSVHEQMRTAGGRFRLFNEIESEKLSSEELSTVLSTASDLEKNILLLWTAFLGHTTSLLLLLEAGADPHYYDARGLSPLHTAAFSGSAECTSLLVTRGADPNFAPHCLTPLHCAAFGGSARVARLLISHGASVHTAERVSNGEGGLLQCAVHAGSVECLTLFIEHGVNVSSLKPNGINAIHLAADYGKASCLNVLLAASGADPNVRIQVGERESTALHLAAIGGYTECINLLLDKGADVSLENHHGVTALHFAARASSLECVELLLRKGKANPNAIDFDKRTPLHAAIGKRNNNVCQIIEMLISWGANVNQKDKYGFTPIHLAALEGLSQCVETLIHYEANVTSCSTTGISALKIIARKTPASLTMITRKLDCAITLHNSEFSSKEVTLQLNFRDILRHSYPNEISYLNTFVEEGQKEFLQHPLCSAFIYIKWGKIRKYYVARLIFCFIHMLSLTLYVLAAFAHSCVNKNNGTKNFNETVKEAELCQKQSNDDPLHIAFNIKTLWWVLAGITVVEIFRKMYGMSVYSTVKQYLMEWENIIEWSVIVSVFVISCKYTNTTHTWQKHISAFAVLAGWASLMSKLGRLPMFGIYVAMYQKVQQELTKLLMVYSCILVGFTISFSVIFPNSPLFQNPFTGIITVLIMMIGDYHHHLLSDNNTDENSTFYLKFSAEIVYLFFVISVSVVLMNLLVGIAVSDIQNLKKTAGLSKLVRQTKLISSMELPLFNNYLPKCLLKILRSSILLSPKAYRVAIRVKPLDPNEKRLPQDLMLTAYEIAKLCEEYGYTTFSKESASAYFRFKRYASETGAKDEAGWGSTGRDFEELGTVIARLDEIVDSTRQLATEVRELKHLAANQ